MAQQQGKGTIVIAGASGGIGRRAAEAFQAAGWTVRRYQRGTDLAQVAQGADVIFNGLNPPMYHNWPVEIPRITAQVIAAAKASGATILMPGTVYVYGAQPGPWSETTPHLPCSRKGEIRAQMERDLRAAAAEGLQVIVLRAGDFLDADNPGTLLRTMVLRGLSRDRITATGTPGSVRTYAYLPDLARAMVALADQRDRLPRFTEIGFPGLRFSYDQLAAMIGRIEGRQIRVRRFPWWTLRLAGPFWELARELTEMRYLHDLEHEIDGGRFAATLPGFTQTPLETVIRPHLPQGQGQAVPQRA